MFPPDSDAFTYMEAKAREIFGRCGFRELRTPIVEHTELFCRSIGEETDVVQKEMYTFPDRKGRSLTLRPEATAGVMRAYIDAAMHSKEPVSRLFTTGPMFRYERPQKGRMRQFHQLNCECLGSPSPYTDADMIIMAMTFLKEIGLKNLTLKINSLGCPQCRAEYKKALLAYLKGVDSDALCEDCRRRAETNPLRVLDCKQPVCRELTDRAPTILEHNCPDCRAHYDVVLHMLSAAGINLVQDDRLVRGLDYYCNTTFEVVSDEIGAQGSVAGGGRYNGLIKQLGGPDIPGVGFACGMERLALLLPSREANRPDFFSVAVGEGTQDAAFVAMQKLRACGVSGTMAFGGGFKSQMRQADKSGARFCLVFGEDELKSGTVGVKDMQTGEQTQVPLDSLENVFRKN